jgi:hypothetical protein
VREQLLHTLIQTQHTINRPICHSCCHSLADTQKV